MPENGNNIKNDAASHQSPTWLKILNGGFVVTLLGGVLVTLLTIHLQNIASERKQEAIRLQEIIDMKISLLAEFSDGITQSLQVSHGMLKRQIWLKSAQRIENKEGLEYPDERNFTQTRNMYESMRREFNKLRHPDSLCAQVLAIYDDTQVRKSVIRLDEILDKYMSTEEFNELDEFFHEASDMHQEIIMHMGNNLTKKPTNKN